MEQEVRAALAGVLLVSCAGTVARADMISSGELHVSQNGTAVYAVPFKVPPGIAGIQPGIALSYDSMGRDGLLGAGWGISGISAVGRCPRTLPQDGAVGSINFDDNDRFCLDGQRLIVISGAYGADGAEYRTEFESHSKIISYGRAGNGPAWFKVWAKNGQVLEYGNTTDSRVEAQGSATVANWALNRLSDRYTNYLTATYVEDNANSQFYISRIDYTGNTGKSASPANSVRFVYETRPDVLTLYHAGRPVRNTVRLSKVQTFQSSSLVREYKTTYERGVATGRSRLTSLSECDAAANCLPATRFAWSDHEQGFGLQFKRLLPGATTATNSFLSDGNHLVLTGDFNGDGMTDLFHLHPNPDPQYSWVGLAKGDGTFNFIRSLPGASLGTSSYLSAGSSGENDFTVGDFNGDGLTDVLHLQKMNPTGFPNYSKFSWVALSNGDGTFTFSTRLLEYGITDNTFMNSENRMASGDFNGDGRTDLVSLSYHSAPQYSFVALSNGDATFNFTASLPGSSVETHSYLSRVLPGGRDVEVGDYNGDGRMDMLHLHLNPDPKYSWIATSNGDATFNFASSVPSMAGPEHTSIEQGYFPRLSVGDWNGDGKLDLLHLDLKPEPQYSWAALSKGDGTFDFQHGLPGMSLEAHSYITSDDPGMIAGDWNSDGLTDLLHLHAKADPKYSWVAYSNGDSTFRFTADLPGASVATNSFLNDYRLIVSGDFNGDGQTDLLHLHPNTDPKYSWVALSRFAVPDLLKSVTTGLGVVTQVEYKPLTDKSVYDKLGGAARSVYPKMDIQAPVYVVASVSTGDGVGGTSTTTYQYSGLKLEHGSGRGLLGFKSMRVTDTATNQATLTEFLQYFPFIGSTERVTKYSGAGSILTLVRNTHACLDSAGSACAPVLGKRYMPYLQQSVEKTHDLNGALFDSVVTTHSELDAYGNVGRVVIEHRNATGAYTGYRKTTVNTFQNDPANWILGRLKRSTVRSESSRTAPAGVQ